MNAASLTRGAESASKAADISRRADAARFCSIREAQDAQARDHLLCAVKLPASGHQFGGRDQAGTRHRRDPPQGVGGTVRGRARRPASVLQEAGRPVPRPAGDPEPDSFRGVVRVAPESRRPGVNLGGHPVHPVVAIFPLSLLPGRPTMTMPSPDLASILGFAGLWLMVDEAHITTIAMHPNYRRRGLGEFMLVSLIDIAYNIGAKWVTLEVRVTNHSAQNLYRKYGFHEAGVRHRYYSDNNEDALIMWTEEINSPAYKRKYQELKTALLRKLVDQ